MLPKVDEAVKTCATRTEFQKKFNKLYGWLWANRMLDYVHQKIPRCGSHRKLNETEKGLSLIRRKSTLKAWKQKPENKVANRLRNRLCQAVKRIDQSKKANTFALVGCSPLELKAHLEKNFLPGMSWSNHGKWHIDRRTPCIAFDLSTEEGQRACFNYANLQPLWAKDNLSKSAKIY